MLTAVVMLAAPARDSRGSHSQPRQSMNVTGERLAPGDIVFRRTDGLLGTIVLETDRASEFSHVGIVVSVEPTAMVVHADPSPDADGAGRVMLVSLEEFLSGADASAFAVYRLRQRDSSAALRAAAWALVQARRGVPFDGALNLNDTTAVYCTELVWRAYQRAGVRLVVPGPRRVPIPFGPDTVMLVSALAASPLLVQIVRGSTP